MIETAKKTKRFIFTGTPGSGKTSVICALKELVYDVTTEAVTDVIAQEQQRGNLRPWEHSYFIDKIILLQRQRQSSVGDQLQFYDRSFFCTYALAQYMSFPISPLLTAEIDACLESNFYDKKVFFFENLGSIEQTKVRTINYKQALVFEQYHFDVYQHFGFELVIVPKKSIKERCDFILQLLASMF